MNLRRYISLLLVLLATTLAASAQNTLSFPALQVAAGKTVSLPLALDNSDEIVAVQFTLQLPFAIATDAQPAVSDLRSAGGHTIDISPTGAGTYTVLITNLTNRPIPGNAGTLAELPMTVSPSAQPDETYDITMTNIVLADRTGRNVSSHTAAATQTLRIQRLPSPDLECADVSTQQTKILPGKELTLRWTARNVGDAPTGAGWKEQISLVSSLTGLATHLGTAYCTDALPAHGSIERRTTINLPQVLAMSDDAFLRVSIEPTSETGEYETDRANNTATSDEAYKVASALFLSAPITTMTEGETSARITLTRSGDRTLDETVSLTQTIDGALTMPATVSIPSGQSTTTFDITARDNDTVNDYDTVTLTATAADNTMAPATLTLAIEDEDSLPMTITTDKTDYDEGDTIHGTISVPRRIGTKDLTAFLFIEQEKRFRLPLTVVFDKGATSASFDIPVLQDNVPANTISIELTATAERYERATTLFVLNDDDVPAISLSLNTDAVSEAAGPQAIHATISRSDVTTSNVTVRLSDDSSEELYYTESFTLEEGVKEKTVVIGVADNNRVDGERQVTLTAEVFISACDCNVVGSKQTTVTQTITLLDNDGPTLTLSADRSTILEGDAAGTVVTVERNTAPTAPLTVKLAVNHDGLTLPASLTIPAGETTATFTLSADRNDVQEGNYIANITAEAEGFSKGVAWLMVSDQTLPDLEITALTLSTDEVMAGDDFSATVTVKNVGAAPTPERSKVSLNMDIQSITLTIAEPIAVGESKVLNTTFTAPEVPGSYDLTARANANVEFTELQTYNNDATATLSVASCYTLTLQADRETYNQGETIILSGTATSTRGTAEGLKVEPYVIYFGARTALEAQVDPDGTFVAIYKLPEGMGGDFGFGVCIPGENATTVMARANVHGIARKSPAYIQAYLHPDEPIDIEVPVMNLSNLPLHNLTATCTDESGHITTVCPAVSVLEGNAEVTLRLTTTSTQITKVQDWERVKVLLNTDEGASLSFTIYTFTSTPLPLLTLGTTQLSTTINKNRARTFPIVVTNLGMGETGKVSVDIPAGQKFVSLASAADIPSLAYGDSTTVVLKFNPEDLDANVVQRGSIAFNCENGDSQMLYYNLKTVSDEKGSLRIRVQDENTIYGNAAGEHPYVSGATVTVKDYNSGAVLLTADTDASGYTTFADLNEGAYTLLVTAPRHDSYTQNVLVSPGETTDVLASISYQAISVSWDVVETTTEDKYEITTELVYETRVPVPVVTCTYPEEMDLNPVLDGTDMLFNIVVRNEGLITAQNVCVALPQREGFVFTPLAEYEGFELAPEQSRVIPVYVSYSGRTPAAIMARYSAPPRKEVTYTCTDEVMWGWEWVCSESSHAWLEKPVKWLLRTCTPHGTPDPPTVSYDPPGKGIDPHWTGPNYSFHPRPSTVDTMPYLYNAACKISCMMACLFPDPIPPCFPMDQKNWKFQIQPMSCLYETGIGSLFDQLPPPFNAVPCIIKAGNKDYNLHKAPARAGSPTDQLEAKFNLYADVLAYNLQLTNLLIDAPELLADQTTADLVLPCIADVNWMLEQYHEKGELYTMTRDELHQALIELMPIKRATWHDFDLDRYIERQINTYRMGDGMSYDPANYVSDVLLQQYEEQLDALKCQLVELGLATWESLAETMIDEAQGLYNGDAGTCATVTLQIKQEMVLTRQAFRGTMVIANDSDHALTDINAVITATDEDGNVATSHEMQINVESTDGFTADGEHLQLAPGQKGTVTYLFIPTKHAAPTNDVRYSFGGTLYFHDGNDLQARSLYPVTLTVRPTPELDLTYFMQSDIYGDNPLTRDVVEPVIPAEFTVLINNKGKGEATNVRMITHQPEVVENEKGLLVDFAIVSSSLNGAEASLALEDDIATEFGNIPAGTTTYATWGLTCNLLGHFTDYDVSYTHLTSYGNPDLSLLDQVTIHKLAHSVNTHIGGKTVRAWVTDDFADAENEPDHIYFANGTDDRLETLSNVTSVESIDATHFRITVDVPIEEWFYLSVNNPGGRRAKVVAITREDTGEALDLEAAWTTQYTMRQGKNPLEEYRFHLVDKAMEKATHRYIVELEPMPEKELTITITGVPEGEKIAEQPIGHLYVNFNKPIDPTTFTRDDIVLRREGQQIDTPLPINQLTPYNYTIDTSRLTDNGYYALQIIGEGITDAEGFQGINGAATRWMLYRDGMVHYLVRSYPSDTYGQILGATAGQPVSTDYGTQLQLNAKAATGASFAYWGKKKMQIATANKIAPSRNAAPAYGDDDIRETDLEVFSTNPSITVDMVRDCNLYAVFRPDQHNVTFNCPAAAGTVNQATGSYPYGQQLHLVATAAEGYEPAGFAVDGVTLSSGAEMDYVVEGDAVVEVRFRSLAPASVILSENRDYVPETLERANVVLMRSFVKGRWNTICLPCPVEHPDEVFGPGTRVARLERYEAGFVNFATCKSMEANVPYLIQPGSILQLAAPDGTLRTTTYDLGLTTTSATDDGQQPADRQPGLTFIGTYTQQDIAPDDGNFTFADDVFTYVDAYTPAESQRFRAYFHTDDANLRELRLQTDGTPTALTAPLTPLPQDDIYSMDGIRHSATPQLRPGIYVTRGHKILVK